MRASWRLAETNIGGLLFFGEVDDEVLGNGGVQVFVDDVCVVLDGVVGGEHFLLYSIQLKMEQHFLIFEGKHIGEGCIICNDMIMMYLRVPNTDGCVLGYTNPSLFEWTDHILRIREVPNRGEETCALDFLLEMRDEDVGDFKKLLGLLPRSHAYYIRFIYYWMCRLPKYTIGGKNAMIPRYLPGGYKYELFNDVLQLLFRSMSDDYVDVETGDTKMYLMVETVQLEGETID